MSTPQREKFGQKGVSRVTVYRRPRKESPFVYMEWWPNGKRVARRMEVEGVPVQDWEVARQLARRIVRRLEEQAARSVWEAVSGNSALPSFMTEGISEVLAKGPVLASAQVNSQMMAVGISSTSGTMETLFERWLQAQEANIRMKGIAKRIWVETFGAKTIVGTLAPADVNEKVKEVAEEREWVTKTIVNRVAHLRMAIAFAQDQLEWKAPNPKQINIPETEDPDTMTLTYTDSEYNRLIDKALEILCTAETNETRHRQTDRQTLSYSEVLLVAAALAIIGIAARRIGQTVRMTLDRVSHTTRLQNVRALEFRFPRTTEKAKRHQDANWTLATVNELQHRREYQILMRLLNTPGVTSSGQLFPDISQGKSLLSKLGAGHISPAKMRKYLTKLETLAGVKSVDRRAFHGLKRYAVTRCKTEEELNLLSRVSNTSCPTLRRYHKKLGTFENRETRRAEDESLQRAIEEGDDG